MRNPTTWEEATQDAAVQMPSWRDGEDLTLDEVLHDIEETLDDLRGGDFEKNEYDAFRYLAWLGAVGYVLEKFGPATKGSTQINFVQRCEDVVKTVLILLPKKQHDYGPDNILWGGVQGVVVRAHDKLARIKNLRERAHNAALGFQPGRIQPENESLTDSYFDLIGYGIVGAMLVKGTFQLPLEADLLTLEITVDEADAYFDEEDIRAIVRDELAKREQAKSHG